MNWKCYVSILTWKDCVLKILLIIRISFHNNFEAASIFIPPLLLQPFAENAIWHGLMHKEGQGTLEIAFELENNMLILLYY